MKSRLLLLVVSLSVLAACGGSKSSTSTTTGGAVSISPTTASVATNTTVQFTATNSSNSGVYWSVNGVIGGNLTVGTVSTTGLYTAPAVVPNPAEVTVTATSISDSTQTGT